MGSKRRKICAADTELGRQKAREWVDSGENGTTKDQETILMELTGCCRRTARGWIKDARNASLRDESGIDTLDVEATRSSEVHLWACRARKFYNESNNILDDEEIKNKAPAANLERVAMEYQKMIARATGVFERPVMEDLSRTDIRRVVLEGVVSKIGYFSRGELGYLREAVFEQLAKYERAGVPDETVEVEEDAEYKDLV